MLSLRKMAEDKRTKSPETPKVAKMDFFSSGEEEEPEPDRGETQELLIEDRTAVVGVILIYHSKYQYASNLTQRV